IHSPFVLFWVSSNLDELLSSNHGIFPRDNLSTRRLVIVAAVVPIGVSVLRAEHVPAPAPESNQPDPLPASRHGAPGPIPRSRRFSDGGIRSGFSGEPAELVRGGSVMSGALARGVRGGDEIVCGEVGEKASEEWKGEDGDENGKMTNLGACEL
ncbi:actin-binding LIM protein 3, partial [Striga asiatica]